jgi:hypothetical protein
MMWEIARASEVTSAEYVRQIGRLRDSFHGVYRRWGVEPAMLCAGFIHAGE